MPHTSPRPPAQRHILTSGWSLIELLLVLACMALLTSLALPAYDGWRQRSQRSQARLALLQAAQWLERSAAANGRYPKLEDVPANIWQVEGVAYQIQASLREHSFVLQAVPLGAQANDACGSLSLDQSGQTGVSRASLSAATCWQR